MTRTMLWLHKWIGILMGVLVFIWLASGVVMVLPFKPVVSPNVKGTFDPSLAAISPARAVELVATREGDTAQVRSTQTTMIAGRAYYEVKLRGGKSYLIDVATGDRLTVTAEVAESIARLGLPKGLASNPPRLVKANDWWNYPHGSVPAYRVEFQDPWHTVAYVGVNDGETDYTTSWLRLRWYITDLHSFRQLGKAGHVILGITSMIALGLVFTGYYLVLPRRWQRWFARRTGMQG